MIYTYDRLVNFLRSPEELAFVAAYPNENIVLDVSVPVCTVVPTTHQARMDARRKAAAASEEFGPSAWYRILKLMSASGLVAKLANTDMIWSERLNEGDPIPVNMGGYGRNFEMAIDAEMKTGEDVAGVSKRCDECNAAVVRVSKFLERRRLGASARKAPIRSWKAPSITNWPSSKKTSTNSMLRSRTSI